MPPKATLTVVVQSRDVPLFSPPPSFRAGREPPTLPRQLPRGAGSCPGSCPVQLRELGSPPCPTPQPLRTKSEPHNHLLPPRCWAVPPPQHAVPSRSPPPALPAGPQPPGFGDAAQPARWLQPHAAHDGVPHVLPAHRTHGALLRRGATAPKTSPQRLSHHTRDPRQAARSHELSTKSQPASPTRRCPQLLPFQGKPTPTL